MGVSQYYSVIVFFALRTYSTPSSYLLLERSQLPLGNSDTGAG
jgi:hypothetical protein